MISFQNNGRTTGGCTRRGFLPGQSGNPGGRPKGLAKLCRELTDEGEEIVRFMVDVLKGKRATRISDRIRAAEWLADRGWGKAVEMQMDLTPEAENEQIALEIARLWAQGKVPMPEDIAQRSGE